MFYVAGRAIQGSMDTRVFLKFLYLTAMTGEAWPCHLSGQGDLQRGMGVLVALQAVIQPKMRGIPVAPATVRDNVPFAGGVPFMTVNAGDFVPVSRAVFFD
jgi:hypothetical protein